MRTQIEELRSTQALSEAWEVLKHLRPKLTEQEFLEIIRESNGAYRLVGLRANSQIVSVAGIEVQTNLYDYRHLRVHDLVTLPEHRSHGFGKALLEWIEQLADQENCQWVVLSSSVKRDSAHRFYRSKMDYELMAHVFMKRIGEP